MNLVFCGTDQGKIIIMLSVYKLILNYWEQKKLKNPGILTEKITSIIFGLLVFIPFMYIIVTLFIYFIWDLIPGNARRYVGLILTVFFLIIRRTLNYALLEKIDYDSELDIKKTREDAYLFLVMYYFVIIFTSLVLYTLKELI